MSRRARVGLLCAASALSLSLAASACGSKVDREGTKKLILKQLSSQNISTSDAACVAKLLDGYSDSELKTLDKEFSKSGVATSDLAKGFQSKTVDCIKGSTTAAMLDEIKKSIPNMTAQQETCATDFLGALSAADLTALGSDSSKANDLGAQLAQKCLT